MNHEKNVRAFIATIPDPSVTQRLIEACELMKSQLPRHEIRWIAPKNWHITLCFLGHITNEQFNNLPIALREKLTGYHSFTILLERIHCFPHSTKPRVLAAAIKANPILQAIAIRTELAANAVGLSPKRKSFLPHLSLARYRTKKPTKLPEPLFLENLHMTVNQIILFRSELTPAGPVYTQACRLPLDAS